MEDTVQVDYEALFERSKELLEEAGLSSEHAKVTAEAICTTTLRGTYSHGIRLLPHYLEAIRAGRIDTRARFEFTKTSLSTGCLDAKHGMAHAAVSEAMDQAIGLAKEAGVGLVTVKNSNHCGAMAYFGLKAAKHNMIGLAFTNATAKLKVFNAKETYFGINPVCVTAPIEGEDPFCFDAAPTVMSNNEIKLYKERGEKLPEGVAADANGRMTTDPSDARMLLPLGGVLAGYKGYGLAMVVDIFCSLLTQMPSGKDVSTMYPADGGELSAKRYLGQFVGAIRIDLFEDIDVFKKRMKKNADAVRNLKSEGEDIEVMIPGDPEKKKSGERVALNSALYSILFNK